MNVGSSGAPRSWLHFGISAVLVLSLAAGLLAMLDSGQAQAFRSRKPATTSSITVSSGPSLGVGCTASRINGVSMATLKITVKNGTAGQTLVHPGLGSGSTAITGAPSQTVSLPATTGTYTIELQAADTTVLKTAVASVNISGSRVSCSVRTS